MNEYNTSSMVSSGSIESRRIARNANLWRLWGIDVEFQCLNIDCPAQSWDVPWHDNGNHNAKHQSCNLCGQRSNWVKFADMEGKFTNLLFGNVYWTPWPLGEELAALGHLQLGPATNVLPQKVKGKAESSQQYAEKGQKRKGSNTRVDGVDSKKHKGGKNM